MIRMNTTREGRRFVLAAFLITIAAVNTGNNLIYLVLALMFSVAVLAVVLLMVNLSGLNMEVSFDGPVFAGEQAYAAVLIRNNKRFIPSYSLRITAEGAVSPVYCAMIPPGSAVQTMLHLRFEKRGLHGRSDLYAESSFPFILLTRRKAAGKSGEVLVYPALIDTEQRITSFSGAEGRMATTSAPSGDEIYSIREYRYGDDRRRIHWKATAKTSDLMVKEYAKGEYKRVTILVDNLHLSPARPGGIGQRDIRLPGIFEKVVSLSGSFARDFLDMGYLVRLMSCRKVVPFGTGRDHLYRILDVTALLAEEPSWESPLPEEEDFVLVVCKSRRTLPDLPVLPGGTVVYADSL